MTRMPIESIRQTLERYGYLDEVTADIGMAYTSAPSYARSVMTALEWTPRDGAGRGMRRAVDAFHRYATLVRETTAHRVDVRDLVECLLVMAVG